MRHGWNAVGARGPHGAGAYHTGRCFGTGWAPFERSAEGTIAFQARVAHAVHSAGVALAEWTTDPPAELPEIRGTRMFARGTPQYTIVLDYHIRELSKAVASNRALANDLAQRIADWAPRALPGEPLRA